MRLMSGCGHCNAGLRNSASNGPTPSVRGPLAWYRAYPDPTETSPSSERTPPMKHAQAIQLAILSIFVVAFSAIGARAQEVVLPKPEPPFQGKIGRTVKDSTPDFPKSVEAPAGAPNILLIMTDDVGFGASSTFGGLIQTPNFQRIADSGLRYNMFHTTALCSPTRAALITGRNHHTNASGVITE